MKIKATIILAPTLLIVLALSSCSSTVPLHSACGSADNPLETCEDPNCVTEVLRKHKTDESYFTRHVSEAHGGKFPEKADDIKDRNAISGFSNYDCGGYRVVFKGLFKKEMKVVKGGIAHNYRTMSIVFFHGLIRDFPHLQQVEFYVAGNDEGRNVLHLRVSTGIVGDPYRYYDATEVYPMFQ